MNKINSRWQNFKRIGTIIRLTWAKDSTQNKRKGIKMRKENKNLTGNGGEGEGGESRV